MINWNQLGLEKKASEFAWIQVPEKENQIGLTLHMCYMAIDWLSLGQATDPGPITHDMVFLSRPTWRGILVSS